MYVLGGAAGLLLFVAILPVREGSTSRVADAIAQRLTVERRVVAAATVASLAAGLLLARIG